MDNSQPQRLEEQLAQEILLMLSMVVLALIQVTLLPAPFGFPPALLLVLIVCLVLLAVRAPYPDQVVGKTLRRAFYGGVALDLLSATPVGVHALALLLAAVLIFALARKMQVEGPLLPFFAVLLGGCIYEIVLGISYASLETPFEWLTYTIVIIIPGVLMMLIPTLPIFFGLRWLLYDRKQAARRKEPRVAL